MEPLLSLLLACSLHLDDPLLLGVIDAFSAGNAFRVQNVAIPYEDDEQLGVDPPPRSPAEARAVMAGIVAAGGAPVLGLLPSRPEWLSELDKSEQKLFEPCQQVEVASSKISEFDYQCRRLGKTARARARRACTLERYGASVGLPALRRFVMLTLEHSPALRTAPPPAAVEASLFRSGGIFFSHGTP